jgi:hypothetical protein
LLGKSTISSKYFKSENLEFLQVLDQGYFGNNNSKLYTIMFENGNLSAEVDTSEVGDGANQFIYEEINNNGEKNMVAYIVLNGSNKVFVGVLGKNKYDFNFGKPGSFDGPREVFTMPEWNYFYVSTYAGKTFVFDKSFATTDKPNLKPIDSLVLNGKGESMNFHPTANHLFVLTPTDEFYSPLNTIDVFYDPTFTSVENEISNINDLVTIYPNPIENIGLLQVSLESELVNNSISKYEIYDFNGNLVSRDHKVSSNNININLSTMNLSSGKYFIRLQLENGFIVKPFSVR